MTLEERFRLQLDAHSERQRQAVVNIEEANRRFDERMARDPVYRLLQELIRLG